MIENPITIPVTTIVKALTSMASTNPIYKINTKNNAVIGLIFGKAPILILSTLASDVNNAIVVIFRVVILTLRQLRLYRLQISLILVTVTPAH